jgi:8-oxo-dGTP diphosphatase
MGFFSRNVERKPVVGGVILSPDGTKFLAARRNYPPKLAGLWELPGGKSESGERPQDTLRRELREELGITVTVLKKLSGHADIGDELRLQVWVARLTVGTPRLIEGHSQVKWLNVSTMWSVNWLTSNKKFVEQIPRHLTKPKN